VDEEDDETESEDEEEKEEEQESEEEIEYVEDFNESDVDDMEDMGDGDDDEELIKSLPLSKKRPLEIEYEPSVTKSKERLKHRRQPSSHSNNA
jgi:hypothetical protein